MKKGFTLFMLLLILIQSTSLLWIAGSFFINRDYVSRNLCINRDKPKSTCNGACQLKKNIEKDQENQVKSGIDAKAKEVLVYFSTTIRQIQYANFKRIGNTFSDANFISFLHEGFTISIFHPPSFTI